ncbi:DNA-binding response regulator in two-component regulatory system with CusS [Candidatus Kuenenia stuttgartiensis]|jgi:heavy metal response regulator|uniref:DNA-binding response regulator in two-component regulatory system with CusS n=1 Tax=Kuenenia stuttgartiensis TaxID=174633 RepID=Q1Q614_KUEST|nr:MULTISPECIES: heavy metal response regulator transcription factor [Kuenenia]MBE7548279.1 heavy metal response regulator transcription factor [Planctomycetia bacterium]MBW7941711.1 heavy metal response regulator transcription factor [Candidatus Kuenenia stuttgartiensis]MBZ0190478.1 heavy metal response regulator transcription factor [Candidatus Kuenenia stuttgartiensis]MCF6150833.1 response regulator [Candidatus Kuenenia stuttgartiensis]MCL4726466.1 heavy metal response regulator transcripti
MRILVIEDEKKLANYLKKGLEEHHFAVDTCNDGEEGLFMINSHAYDLVVLDIMLPLMDGFEILRTARKSGLRMPFLLLTAKDAIEDKVRGLDLGADDYLVKPFSFIELTARIRALIRRGKVHYQTKLTVADLSLDLATHRLYRNGETIDLTNKEFALLEFFLRNLNIVLTRTQITEHVWDYNFDSFTNVVDVFVNRLRNKIDKNRETKLIHTIKGVGYIMKEK